MVWPAAWVDAWDALRAAEDDASKVGACFAIGSDFAFPGAKGDDVSEFANFGRKAIATSAVFFLPARKPSYTLSLDGRTLTFLSGRETEHDVNDRVVCRVRESRARHSAVVILPHWNAAPGSYENVSKYLCAVGVSCGELILPYHGSRNDASRKFSDRFLSANLGLTVRSVQQSVMDTIDVLNWFVSRGYDRLGLIGISLGSCIAGIVAAHYPRISATSLLLTAGDFAEVVWTGRATRHIREALNKRITLENLQAAWAVISTQTYVSKLSRSDHEIEVILASRDNVVLPRLSWKFVCELRSMGSSLSVHEYPCGHYTIGMFPYGVSAFFRVVLLLRRAGFLRGTKGGSAPA